MDRVLAGSAEADDIDDYVAEWHSGDSELSLDHFLGLSWHEYAVWALDGNAINFIIAARRAGVDFNEYMARLKDDSDLAASIFKLSELHKDSTGPDSEP